MKQILIATSNVGKQRELAAMLALSRGQVLSLADVTFDGEAPQVIENGSTFAENAAIKARAYYEALGLPTLADDSGLEVDILEGRPGVYSARYAGEQATDEQNNAKLLRELHDVPFEQRTAQFTCVIVYIDEHGNEWHAHGSCSGLICLQPVGEQGFGYDPLFYLPDKKSTLAEMEAEEKNKISHRSRALEHLIDQRVFHD